MAYWRRKKGKGVFVYVRTDGRPKQVPRKQTKFLDDQPDNVITAWVKANYPTCELPPPLTSQTTDILCEKYIKFMQSEGLDRHTVEIHERALKRDVFPFFLEMGLDNPNEWPAVSIKLRAWLRDKGLSPFQVRHANTALKGFWKFHTEERNINSQLLLHLRPAKISKNRDTPLKYTITPEEVLEWARQCDDRKLRLICLLGFFFSLRPQELFALTKEKFKAGSSAGVLQACKVMREAGLYSKFAVYVDAQRNPHRQIKKPKANSVGWVACFNEAAAKQIVGLLRDYKPDEAFFEFRNEWYSTLWRRNGIPNITLKDLRRSSLYWLGHYSKMEYVALKNHARHADPTTTWLYLRRPDEGIDFEYDELDLDA